MIFLSYAWVDDKLPEFYRGRPGWVRFFYGSLATALGHRLGYETKFWRDVYDSRPDGDFAREIDRALQEATVLIAIVSNSYIARDWCLKELRDFVAYRAGAGEQECALRVLKILKHPVEETRLPIPLRDRGRGFEFYQLEPYTRIERQYFMAGDVRPGYENLYQDQIENIAAQIEALMPPGGTAAATRPPPQSPLGALCSVFVAVPPVASTVCEVYLALVSELQRAGAAVSPKPGQSFPDTAADADSLLSEALESASLAVHLIDDSAGKTCDGAAEPMVRLQLRRSQEEMSRGIGLRRLIWLTGTTTPPSGLNAEILAALRGSDLGGLPLDPVRDDIVTGTFDAFLGQVRRALPNRQEAAAPEQHQRIANTYIVAADEDVAFVRRTLRAQLRDVLGMTIEVPLAADRPTTARTTHEAQHLGDADTAVVYWGARDVDWVEHQLHTLRQWHQLARTRPFTQIVLLVGGPMSTEKDEEDPLAPGEFRIDARNGIAAVATMLTHAFAVTAGQR